MEKSILNKSFFALFVFTLVFVIVFYHTIRFDYTDELCAAGLLGLFLVSLFGSSDWSLSRAFIITLLVFLFYAVYSIMINSNSISTIFSDLIIQMKPYVAFFCAYHLKPVLTNNQKRIVRELCLVIWLAFLLPLGLISIVYKEETFYTAMGHPAYYGIIVTIISLCYYYCSKRRNIDVFIFLIMLSIGVFAGRSKFYGFFVLSVFMMLFFRNRKKLKLSLKNIVIGVIMLTVMIVVAWQKISVYFYDAMTNVEGVDKDMIARYVLYSYMPLILNDYIPFGSGLATYATNSSAVSYSDIYVKYGIDGVWGLSKNYPDFVSDTFYPALAQFGYAGIALFLIFWCYIIKQILRVYKTSKNVDNMIVAILIVGFVTIENTTASTFIAQGGFFVMMMLGLILSDKNALTDKTPHEQTN